MINVRQITKRFGSTIAVNNVSFEVQKGEVVGFLGPNGAGKSTTMKCITCYYSPDAGTVEVNGYDIFKNSLMVRRQIGYLPESNPLYTDLGVVEYLRFIADVHDVPARERTRRIEGIIDRVGLNRMRHKDIGELSKGYKQRVGLAAAMVADPPVLILDEPTTGLDPNQIVEIRALIKELGQEKSLILSTHILPEVRMTCSRIIIISEGRLIDEGTPEELIERAKGELRYRVTFITPDGDLVDEVLNEDEFIKSATLLESPADFKAAAQKAEKKKAAAAAATPAPELATEEKEAAAGGAGEEPAEGEPDLKPVLIPSEAKGTGLTRSAGDLWDRHRYVIVAEGEEDISEHLFDLAMAHGWRLSELAREEVSLEQVFQKLTLREVSSHVA